MSARSRIADVIYRNHTSHDEYLHRVEEDESPVHEVFPLNENELRLRYIALTLGDGDPLDLAEYSHRFGQDFQDDFGATLEELSRANLVRKCDQRIELTERGKLFYDLITRAFYPRPIRQWMQQRQELAETAANLRSRHAVAQTFNAEGAT